MAGRASTPKPSPIAKPRPNEVEVASAEKPDDPISVIVTALLGVMAAVGVVPKNGQNEHFNYSYTTEGDLIAHLRPEMVKQGLVLIPSGRTLMPPDANGTTHIEVDYTLAHRSGAVWPDKIVAFGAGNDRSSKGTVGDKGVYKALTGANKYLLLKLLQIATGDDPEMQDLAHKTGGQTGGNTSGGGSSGGAQSASKEPKKQYYNATDEKAFIDEMTGWLAGCVSSADVVNLMASEDVVRDLDRIPDKKVTAVKEMARVRYSALRKSEPQKAPEKGTKAEEPSSGAKAAEADEPARQGSDALDEMRTGSRREGEGQEKPGEYGNDDGFTDDDDIPF